MQLSQTPLITPDWDQDLPTVKIKPLIFRDFKLEQLQTRNTHHFKGNFTEKDKMNKCRIYFLKSN